MHFYGASSGFYDLLDKTYFMKEKGNPRKAVSEMIQGKKSSFADTGTD